VRAHGVSVHLAVTQLPSYCTGAAQAGAASTQTSRLAPRRHSFVLGRGFGNPIVYGLTVQDNGEPNQGVDVFRLDTETYDVPLSPVTHGNIQVHKQKLAP
jgi:hypothetical protein